MRKTIVLFYNIHVLRCSFLETEAPAKRKANGEYVEDHGDDVAIDHADMLTEEFKSQLDTKGIDDQNPLIITQEV